MARTTIRFANEPGLDILKSFQDEQLRADAKIPAPRLTARRFLAMKLPMLFKSLFDFEADNPAPAVTPATPESSPAPIPQPQPVALAQAQAVHIEEARHERDPLLDAIDALGETVLALDAQLRAERRRSAQLRNCLNAELTALRTALLH